MKVFKSTRTVFVVVMMAILLVSYYFYLSHRVTREVSSKEEDIRATKVQEILMKDLSKNYPVSPKEVVKFYSEITQAFYNEEYTDGQLLQLGQKAQELYDDELIANQGDQNIYLNNLKADVKTFKDGNIVISSYAVGASTDVEYFTEGGRECAGMYCDYTMREGTTLKFTKQLFILRKDGQGHWKILGWEQVHDNNG